MSRSGDGGLQDAVTVFGMTGPKSPMSRLAELGGELQRTVDDMADLFRQESAQACLTSLERDELRTAVEYARMAGGEIVVLATAACDRAQGRNDA